MPKRQNCTHFSILTWVTIHPRVEKLIPFAFFVCGVSGDYMWKTFPAGLVIPGWVHMKWLLNHIIQFRSLRIYENVYSTKNKYICYTNHGLDITCDSLWNHWNCVYRIKWKIIQDVFYYLSQHIALENFNNRYFFHISTVNCNFIVIRKNIATTVFLWLNW